MIGEDFATVLKVNLSTRKYAIEQRPDLLRDYLGGSGVGARLLQENGKHGADPLDPEQPVILAIGPMEFIFPMVTKVTAFFKSPLSGELGESHAGGRLGMTMRMAGYDAIVITGRSREPILLNITGRKLDFIPATPLWGMPSDDTGMFARKLVYGQGKRSILRIGPAGERLIPYSSVNVDSFRHFGRLGLGAVLGSKNLKAMVLSSEKSYAIPDLQAYKAVYEEIFQKVTQTDVEEKYHDLGTPENILPLNAFGGLPTRNLAETRFEGAEDISGEAFARELLTKKLACAGCPVGCIHIGLLRRQFGKSTDAYEYKSDGVNYDYELIYAMGSLLGLRDKTAVLELIAVAEADGLDVMTAGVLLAWMTEAQEKRLVTEEMAGVKLAFGQASSYREALANLTLQPTEFYRELAADPLKTAQKYGGRDFLLFLNGNGMAGYFTGYGSMLGQLFGARHSHLDNGGYSLDQKEPGLEPEALVKKLIAEEEMRNVLTSLVICLFARKVYDYPTICKALGSIGIARTQEDLTALGKRIYRLKLDIKRAMGYEPATLSYPARILETPAPGGPLSRESLEEMKNIYMTEIALE
jgi:aldehyde:ferredoxin oxidoreductase